MPVVQNRICGIVLSHFAKTSFKRGLSSCAADATFRVADDSVLPLNGPRFHQRLDCQVCSCGITPWIGNEAGMRDPDPAEFRQSIDRLRQQLGLSMRLL